MRFNRHSDLSGLHSMLSPSSYHWINYSIDKLDQRIDTVSAARRGSELHDFASQAITLGIKLPKTQATLNQYVNDCIGWRMSPEVLLYYSMNCFGTADAIAFRQNILRISDLKTGTSRTSVHQLEVYAALFFLEYNVKLFEVEIELRIYQEDGVTLFETDRDAIAHIMDRIQQFDKHINQRRKETEL